jgi:hypothetical protein
VDDHCNKSRVAHFLPSKLQPLKQTNIPAMKVPNKRENYKVLKTADFEKRFV